LRDLAVVDARETELVPSAADGDAIGVFRARLGAVLPGQAQMSVVPGSMPGPTGGRLPSSTYPTNPFSINAYDEEFDMLFTAHNPNKAVPTDLAFIQGRVRAETM
jgi:hypothetical protein